MEGLKLKKEAKDMKKNEIIKKLEEIKTRSAWARGVKNYAIDLVNDCGREEITIKDIKNGLLLNGAKDWEQYSWGGCALCYDCDIARALCAPWELKKTKDGERNPNSRESWLDVQARALYQAERKIKNILRA